MKFISIRSKVLITVFVTTLIWGVISTYIVYQRTSTVLIEHTTESLINTTSLQEEKLSQLISANFQLAETIAQNKTIRQYLEVQNENTAILNELLENYNIADNYSAIYVLDTEGKTLLSTDPNFIDKNYSFRDYFTAAIEGNNYLDVSIGVTSNELGYYISSPVYSEAGRIIGVTVLKLKPETIAETITNKLENLENIFLVDQFAVVIYSKNEDKLFHRLAKVNLNIDETTWKTRYGNYPMTYLDYDLIVNKMNTLSEATLFEKEQSNAPLGDTIVTISPIQNTNFYFLAEINSNTIVTEAKTTALNLSAIIFISSLFISLIISIIINKTLLPLTQLIVTAKRIAKGHLEERVSIHTKDEFETLGEAFNEMTDKLVTINKKIEKKVNERTEELEKIVAHMTHRELKMIELKKRLETLEQEKNEN